ncbi:uncharacterized protein LOC143035132 [Oratosquilla oratoria]|uniref:uncharacterized protein LOC143035132 n=1 Tax=Oratosquilla oratoria TaxID=337810 RepID=UPI003F7777B8
MHLNLMTPSNGSCRHTSTSSSSLSSQSPLAAQPSYGSSSSSSLSSSTKKSGRTTKPKTTFFFLVLTCADVVAGIPSSPVASSLPLPILGDGAHNLAVHRNATADIALKHLNYHNYILHSFGPPFHRDWRKRDRNHTLSFDVPSVTARQIARKGVKHGKHSSDKAKQKTDESGDSNHVRGSNRSSSSSSSVVNMKTANMKTANKKTAVTKTADKKTADTKTTDTKTANIKTTITKTANTEVTNTKTANSKGPKQRKSGKKEIFKIHITRAWRKSQTTTTKSPPTSPLHPQSPSTTSNLRPHKSPLNISHKPLLISSPHSTTVPPHSTTSSVNSSFPFLYNSPTSSSLIPSTSSIPFPATSSTTPPPSALAPSTSSPFHLYPVISSTSPTSSLHPPSSYPPHFSPSPSFLNSQYVKTSIVTPISSSFTSPPLLSSSSPSSPSPVSSSSSPYSFSSPSSTSSSFSSIPISSSSPPTTEEQADTTMLSGRVLLEMQNFQDTQAQEDEDTKEYDVTWKESDVTYKDSDIIAGGDISSEGSDGFSSGIDVTHTSLLSPQDKPKLHPDYSPQRKNILPEVTVNNNHEKNPKHTTNDMSNENAISHYINRENSIKNSNTDNLKPTASALVSEATDSLIRNSIESSARNQSASNHTHSNSISNQNNAGDSGVVSNLINLINNRSNGINDTITYNYNDTKATREMVNKFYNSSDIKKIPTHVKLDSLEVELSGKSETAKDLFLAIYILQHHDLLGLNESYPDAVVPDSKDFEEETEVAEDGEAIEEHLRHIEEAAEEAQRSKSSSEVEDSQGLFRSQKEKAAYNSLYPFPKETNHKVTEPPDVSIEKVDAEKSKVRYSGDFPPKTTSQEEHRSSSKSGQYVVEVLDSFSPTSDYDFTTYSEEPPSIADDEEVSMQEPETCFLWFVLVMDGNCSVIKPRMNTFVTFLKAALSAKVPLEYEDVHVPSVFCDASFMVNISIDSKKYPDVDKRLQSLAAANITLLEISGEIFYLEKVLTRKDQGKEQRLLGKKTDDVEIVIYIAVGCMCAFIILSVVIVTLIKICKQDLEGFDLNKHHTLSGNDFPIRRPNVIYSPRFTQDLDPEKYRLRPFDDPLVVESTSRSGGAGGVGCGGGPGTGEVNRGGPHLKDDLCPSPLRYGSEQVEEVTIEAPEQFRDDFTSLVDSDTNDKDELCEVLFDTPSPRRTRKMKITAMAKRAAAAAAAAATSVRSNEQPNLTLDNPCYDR